MTIEELNKLVDKGEIDEFIRVCEARQVKHLSKIADDISARGGVRLVLLAGASSAGKTTTSKRLCTQLRVNGCEAVHLSTDDYFVGDAHNPRDANGEFDYECVECVDRDRLLSDLGLLLKGRAVRLRGFNFHRHEGFDRKEETVLSKGGIVILEGIHALNPVLTPKLPDAAVYRMFVEPRTQLEVFVHTRLPSTDGRLLRRLVRDNQFRKLSPTETFRMWPKVLDGERLWIDPFKNDVDAFFDSGLEYELAVLKNFVAGLLEIVRRKMPGEVKAEFLFELLSVVHDTDPTKVPGDSILRETIGGSQLDY
ncbi:MAG TPA: hypothetical protein DDY72_03765 [Verrucomicrobia bacterium]|mgnify:FL=1|nr:hypothetical protein [Verrucomicrobiota bacterium]